MRPSHRRCRVSPRDCSGSGAADPAIDLAGGLIARRVAAMTFAAKARGEVSVRVRSGRRRGGVSNLGHGAVARYTLFSAVCFRRTPLRLRSSRDGPLCQ